MRAISRMRSLVSPTLSASSPPLPKSTSLLRLYFSPSRESSVYKSSPTPQLPGYSLKSSMPSSSSFSPLIPTNIPQNRGLHAEASPSSSGEIHVIVGPMFAGKTTTLLRRVQHESEHGRSVALIKSNKDTRYGLESIMTHDGVKFPCWALADLSSFRQKLGSHAYDKLNVIGIDEAQFFEDLYDFCQEAADHDGKTVIVAGLDGDYLRGKKKEEEKIHEEILCLMEILNMDDRRSFGSVVDIIPIADSVTKLTARCEMCGRQAFFTLRKTEETQTELVGGADVYMPVCRQHYVSGQGVIEAARTVLLSQNVRLG